MCSFVWINCFLPFLLHSLSSSLYQGSVASVCCQKQHITAFWPMSWLLSWFPFVFSVLHTLPASVLLPAACWIFFFLDFISKSQNLPCCAYSLKHAEVRIFQDICSHKRMATSSVPVCKCLHL